MAQRQRSRAGGPAAEVVFSGKEIAPEDKPPHRTLQVLTDDGHQLPRRRQGPVPGRADARAFERLAHGRRSRCLAPPVRLCRDGGAA